MQDAITALFGADPHTQLPQDLMEWVPTSAVEEIASSLGVSPTRMVSDGLDIFCSDPRYFDEVTAAALSARANRNATAARFTSK